MSEPAPPAAPTTESPTPAAPTHEAATESPTPAAPTPEAAPAARTTEAATHADAPAPTYEVACARIEEIIKRLDTGQAGLRETLELCQEGRRLVEFCAAELEAVGRGLEELRLDELVARLESGRAAAPA
jgi:exodeoxyribonuclease VII small subunit